MSLSEQLYLDHLRRTQWFSTQELQRYQRPLIERMLRHAAVQAPFYADRLRHLFRGTDLSTAVIDPSGWSKVPIATRAEITAHLSQVKARQIPPESGEVIAGCSIGITGVPLHYVRSATAESVSDCLIDRVYELFSFDLFGSMARIGRNLDEIYPYPFGLRRKQWNRTAPNADYFALDIGASAVEQLEWLRRVRPDYVLSYPNNLRAVAQAISANGTAGPKFKGVVTTGEVLTPGTRNLLAQAFECPIIDVYCVSELGPIAFQCPQGAGYHLCAESNICEILDDNGYPSEPGEMGRVVVTSLYNFAMPFIRYELGDRARALAFPCRCGRGLPTIDLIAGRIRNLFVMPDGTRNWPALGPLFAAMSKHLNYRQIQLVQTAVNRIEIKYIPLDGQHVPDLAALTHLLRAEFHAGLQLQLIPVDNIARGPKGCTEQFITMLSV